MKLYSKTCLVRGVQKCAALALLAGVILLMAGSSSMALAHTGHDQVSPFTGQMQKSKVHCKLHSHPRWMPFCPHMATDKKGHNPEFRVAPDCGGKNSLPVQAFSPDHNTFLEDNRPLLLQEEHFEKYSHTNSGDSFTRPDALTHPPKSS